MVKPGQAVEPTLREEEGAADGGNPACVGALNSLWFSSWARCGAEAAEQDKVQAGVFHGMWSGSQQRRRN